MPKDEAIAESAVKQSDLELPNPQTTPGHYLLRCVIPTGDLRSPEGAPGNSQGRKPLEFQELPL